MKSVLFQLVGMLATKYMTNEALQCVKSNTCSRNVTKTGADYLQTIPHSASSVRPHNVSYGGIN